MKATLQRTMKNVMKLSIVINLAAYFSIIKAKVTQNFEEDSIHSTTAFRDLSLITDYGKVVNFPKISGNFPKSPNEQQNDYKILLETPDERFYLKLSPLKKVIIGPNITSQWMEDDVMVARVFPRHCWFEASISERGLYGTGTTAIVSLCGGLRAVISTLSTEYHIQPTGSPASKTRSHSISHVIERRPIRDGAHNETDQTLYWEEGENSMGPEVDDHSRYRRALFHRNPRHLEILLVADLSVVRFHGRSLVDQYLLTQLNIVNAVYHHPSLEVEINVVVVDIVYLTDTEMKNLVVDNDEGKDTLKKFCNWTSERWHNSRFTGQHFDAAVYLTKHNIGPAGYAPVTGMCNPARSCAVIKDDGISSAFVVAHELGHIFGMVHDGEAQAEECGSELPDGKIMSPMVQSNYENYYWSNCSSAALANVLEDMYCLNNEPAEPHWPRYSEPFGQSWTLDEQCRQEFGADFIFCKALKHNCEHLWCEKPDDHSLCKTKRSPPLSGTTCGDNMWCLNKQCVSKKTTPRVDGGWAAWSDWGDCSRTCGTGVQYRYRTCTNPAPQYGGRQCDGTGEDFRLCGQKPCSIDADTRAEQCRRHNEVNFHGRRRHNWLPIENKNETELCKLTCVSQYTRDTFTTEKNVIDGTPCSYEVSHDICMKGTCQKVGCDGVLHSTKREDMCGHCGGDNSGCITVSDVYKGNLGKMQYHRVLVLPKYAMNIRIRESETNPHLAHFLAIRDPETDIFWLNGNERRNGNMQFVVHKSRFMYFITKDGESLSARGPLLAPLELMVYSYSEKLPTQIEFQYYLSKDVKKPVAKPVGPRISAERYKWGVVAHSACTKECGGGTQEEEFECLDVEKKTVSEGLCPLSTRPAGHAMPCNNHPCQTTTYYWEAKPWQKCSTTCGISGWQRRTVFCEASLQGKRWQVEPYYCNVTLLPSTTRQCNRMACPASWAFGPWSKCSVTCGEGHMVRTYYCAKPSDGNKYTCDHLEPPPTHKTCRPRPCAEELATASLTTATSIPPEQVFTPASEGGSIDSSTLDHGNDLGNGGIETADLTTNDKEGELVEGDSGDYNPGIPETLTDDVSPVKGHLKANHTTGEGVDARNTAKHHQTVGNAADHSRDRARAKPQGKQPNNKRGKKRTKHQGKTRNKVKVSKPKKNSTDVRRKSKHSRKSTGTCQGGDKSALVCRVGANAKNCRRRLYKKLCCQSCGQF